MKAPRLLLAAAAVLLLAAAPSSARAQDAAVVNAKTIQVKFENDRVRVLETVLKPGDKEQLHSHSANIFYVLEGGRMRSHAPDGKSTETELQTGQVFHREPLTHWAENIGTTTVRVLLVEFKTADGVR